MRPPRGEIISVSFPCFSFRFNRTTAFPSEKKCRDKADKWLLTLLTFIINVIEKLIVTRISDSFGKKLFRFFGLNNREWSFKSFLHKRTTRLKRKEYFDISRKWNACVNHDEIAAHIHLASVKSARWRVNGCRSGGRIFPAFIKPDW